MGVMGRVGLGFVALCLVVVAVPAVAEEVSLDPTFSGDGKARVAERPSWAGSIALDGDLVYVSGSGEVDEKDRVFVSRLTDDGVLDPTFAADGMRYLSGEGEFFPLSGLAVDASGRPVMVAQSSQSVMVTRLTTAGALDTSFSGDGKRILGREGGSFNSLDPDVVIDGDGRILVAVMYRAKKGINIKIWRFLPGGKLDTSWSGDGVKTVDEHLEDWMGALAVDGNDRVLLGFDADTEKSAALVTRFRVNGSIDESFGDEGTAKFRFQERQSAFPLRIDVNGAGDITVAGSSFTGAYGGARFNSDGELDDSYGDGGVLGLTCKDCAPLIGDVAGGRVAVLIKGDSRGADTRVTRISASGQEISHMRVDLFTNTSSEYSLAVEIDGTRTLLAGGADRRAFVARLP